MKLVILKSYLLGRFSKVVHGISTKVYSMGNQFLDLGNFNSTLKEEILRNRTIFFKELKIDEDRVVYQKQVHSDKFLYVDSPRIIKDNDALFTDKKNLFLVVTIADCIPILFFDEINKIVGVVHSGWRGTDSKILLKTVSYLKQNMNLSVDKTYFYFGPSICPSCFEVGEEVAQKFEKKYVFERSKKFFVDLPSINFDYLISEGFKKENIHISNLCTYELRNLFHSYRRDKEKSGRMFGVIGLRDE